MKQIVILIVSLILLNACKKSSEYLTPDHVTGTVIVNGSSFSINASGVNATVGRFAVPVINTPYIGVTGWGRNNNNVKIILPDQIQMGTFNITQSGSYVAHYEDVSTGTVYYSSDNSGTITIESYTGNYIKGRFQVTCYDSNSTIAQINNGTFEGDL